MRPQHRSKRVQYPFDLLPPQIPLAVPAVRQVLLQHIHAGVDLLVLLERRGAGPETLHALREDGEDVLLFDVVVHGQVGDEAEAEADQRRAGHLLRRGLRDGAV